MFQFFVSRASNLFNQRSYVPQENPESYIRALIHQIKSIVENKEAYVKAGMLLITPNTSLKNCNCILTELSGISATKIESVTKIGKLLIAPNETEKIEKMRKLEISEIMRVISRKLSLKKIDSVAKKGELLIKPQMDFDQRCRIIGKTFDAVFKRKLVVKTPKLSTIPEESN